MNPFLIKTVSDIEILIGDYKAGLVEEEEFKEKLRILAGDIKNDAMAEEMEKDEDSSELLDMLMPQPIKKW